MSLIWTCYLLSPNNIQLSFWGKAQESSYLEQSIFRIISNWSMYIIVHNWFERRIHLAWITEGRIGHRLDFFVESVPKNICDYHAFYKSTNSSQVWSSYITGTVCSVWEFWMVLIIVDCPKVVDGAHIWCMAMSVLSAVKPEWTSAFDYWWNHAVSSLLIRQASVWYEAYMDSYSNFSNCVYMQS